MADATSSEKPLPSPEDNPSETEGDITALRDIIVGPHGERLERLESRLNDPEVRTREISQHLAEAMVLRAGRDDQIAKALEPSVEEAIRASVQKKPQVLANALFPLMGPGIRKAISATIMGMIQSFNQILNHSFSWQGFQWRLEALRTRRPFAEVVLLHSLVYQVEQVFLIHNQTGLVLNHVVAEATAMQDPDLVSGMLTAIQDFIQDSFSVEAEAGIDTLRVGNDRSVWVERGERTSLAAVIRGTPPMGLRHQLQDVLNRLELKKLDDLDAFDGDTTPFAALDDDLNACLQSKLKAEKTRISPWIWLLLALILGLSVWWGYRTYQTNRRWTQFIEDLQQQPGIVVTQALRRNGAITLTGLRDPLAGDPLALMAAAGFDPERATVRWEPYYALDSAFVLQRARQGLDPPAQVSFQLRGDILVLTGVAPHAWIEGTQRLAPLMPGIRAIEMEGLQSAESLALEDIRLKIENTTIRFLLGRSTYAPGQEALVAQTAELARRAQELGALIKRDLRIVITGHTDASGTEAINRQLSRQRAEQVGQALLTLGVDPRYLTIEGVGASELLHPEESEERRDLNRRVSFKVHLDPE
ncbi:MAG: OmpA family protein [Desulfobacterales bacterium]